MIRCSKCKTQNKDNATYCKLCNHRLSTISETKLYDAYGDIIGLVKAPIRNRIRTVLHLRSSYLKHKRLWRLTLGVCTVIGGLSALSALLPRIVVSPPSMPIDPRNNMSVAFDITNTSVVPLRDVSAAMVLCRIAYGGIQIRGYKTTHGDNGGGRQGGPPDFANLPRFERPEWKHHSLGMDERFTINLGSLLDLHTDLSVADIAIIVKYTPWLLPFPSQKIFRYTAYRDKQGILYWESWTLGEPQPVLH